MLTAIAVYFLCGVMLTLICLETTKQDPKPKLTIELLLVGAVITIPFCIYYGLVKLFGGGVK